MAQLIQPGEIWTAQMNKGRGYACAVDCTVKGNFYFAPTWDIVDKYKAGKITWQQYCAEYYFILGERVFSKEGPVAMENLRMIVDRVGLVLLCYCSDHNFCHRTLFAKFLENWGIGKYKGELRW
jgi:uncharacterized protein YeaO (DUF488 family)